MSLQRQPWWLLQAATTSPHTPAIFWQGQTYSYSHYHSLVEKLAIYLQAHFPHQTHLAISLPPSLAYAVTVFACIRAQMVPVLLNTRLPQQQQEKLAHLHDCQAVVVNQRSDWQVLPEIVISKLLANNDIRLAMPNTLSPTHSLTQVSDIIFSSGSTGTPKAIVHSLANHYYSALGAQHHIPLQQGDCYLISLPLFHVGGLAILFRAVLAKAAIAFAKTEEIPQTLHELPITHLSLVATQLQRLLQHQDNLTNLRSLKAILLGGSAFPPTLIDKAWAAKLPIHTSYGSSEMTSQITSTPPGASLATLNTSGKLLPFRELRISQEGEIWVRGKTLFAGYYQQGKMVTPFHKEGWFATGDLGSWNPQKELVVAGRKDNMFISGGENIQPEEIEKALLAIPEVTQAVVVPIENHEYGQRPVAIIATKGNWQPEYWKQLLAQRLPRWMIPDYFLPCPPLIDDWKVSRPQLTKYARNKLFSP